MILFQCPNQIGLGHMSRLAAIALALRERAPQIRLPFVVEGASHSLLESYQLPYISLPGARDLRQYWTAWSEEELMQLSFSICLALITNLNPDIVVFDCLPSAPFVAASTQRRIPMVLCLRKMRDFESYFDQMKEFLPLMEMVLVPHGPGEFEVPSIICDKTVFVGPIVRPDVAHPATIPGNKPGRNVLITGGGGGYPNTVEFYNLTLRAFSAIRVNDPGITGTLVTGPLFQDWEKLELQEGIKVIPFSPDMLSLFANSALVIAQAGYNTVAELSQMGVNSILVPANRAFDDQFERAMAVSGSNTNLHVFTNNTELELARLMKQCLAANWSSKTPEASCGAAKAAEQLFDLLTCAQARSA